MLLLLVPKGYVYFKFIQLALLMLSKWRSFCFFLELLVVGRQTFDKKELDLGGGFKTSLKNYLHPKLGEDSPILTNIIVDVSGQIIATSHDLTPNGGEK